MCGWVCVSIVLCAVEYDDVLSDSSSIVSLIQCGHNHSSSGNSKHHKSFNLLSASHAITVRSFGWDCMMLIQLRSCFINFIPIVMGLPLNFFVLFSDIQILWVESHELAETVEVSPLCDGAPLFSFGFGMQFDVELAT